MKKRDSVIFITATVSVVIVFAVIAFSTIDFYRPSEISHYASYDNKTYYFNEYYINNNNEVICDVHWEREGNFFWEEEWIKVEETVKIPMSGFIHNIKGVK